MPFPLRPPPRPLRPRLDDRGAASVEHAGLALLIALACAAAVAAVGASPPRDGGLELARALAQTMRCAPRLPDACWHDPLTAAYGRPLAGSVRALAPAPRALPGASGALLLPVDFRTCRSESCALPSARPELTASNRRVSAFVSVLDRRRGGGAAEISYWEYRPTLGWERIVRRASSDEVAALSHTPLPEAANPRLVPLETLAGRNHVDFRTGEEPPWRWLVETAVP